MGQIVIRLNFWRGPSPSGSAGEAHELDLGGLHLLDVLGRKLGTKHVGRAIVHSAKQFDRVLRDVIGCLHDNGPSFRLYVNAWLNRTRVMENTCRLYTDLAWLWPMWGDAAEEYAHYCRHVTGLIERYAKRPAGTLLDIGCGGGKNVFNLKGKFRVTGLDLSPAMLAQALALNPQSTFVQGDMRTFRLGQTFDAVLMDDAISYMACLADFEAAFRAASAHLNPGGVLIATPDVTTETFRQNRTVATPATGARDGLDVVFVENVYDPDPTDEQYEMTILYLIRDHGHLRIETDHWTMGLFPLDTWRRVLRETGFEVHEGRYAMGEEGCTVFACVKS